MVVFSVAAVAFGIWYFAVYDTTQSKCDRGDTDACLVLATKDAQAGGSPPTQRPCNGALEVDGTIHSYMELTTSDGAYEFNQLRITGNSTTYIVNKDAFTPQLPDQVNIDGKVRIWVAPGSTQVVQIVLYDTKGQTSIQYTTC